MNIADAKEMLDDPATRNCARWPRWSFQRVRMKLRADRRGTQNPASPEGP